MKDNLPEVKRAMDRVLVLISESRNGRAKELAKKYGISYEKMKAKCTNGILIPYKTRNLKREDTHGR